MPVLSSPDPSVGIACSLPVLEMADHLDSLQDLVAHGLDGVDLHDRRLRIAIDRDGAADLYAQTVAWAEAKKACCSYLGFAVEETPAASSSKSPPRRAQSPRSKASSSWSWPRRDAVSQARS